ncbi:hypothetical protein [Actinomadura keratinilytica]|uniref:hypothetical protein n=1 Tax=Actinomadura keratinilytica TaxID=547461 RepID=UPI0036231A30
MTGILVCGATLTAALGACALRPWLRSRRGFGSMADEATFATLHTISRASPSLRGGLNRDSARKAARHLRTLLGVEAVALVAAAHEADPHADPHDGPPGDPEDGLDAPCGRLLVWDGAGGSRHAWAVLHHTRPVLESGRPRVIGPDVLSCEDARCRIRVAMVAPLSVQGRVEGRWPPTAAAPRRRACARWARWPGGCPASWSWPSWTPPARAWPRPRCARCAPRSPRTSSTTR